MSKRNPSGKATRTRRATAITFSNRFAKSKVKAMSIKPPPLKFVNRPKEPTR